MQNRNDTIVQSVNRKTLKLVKEVFKDEALTSERYVHVTPPGLILDILGRIDFESETKFLELKSKPINFRKGKNGLTQTIQKLTSYHR
jgi:hypothetical protein